MLSFENPTNQNDQSNHAVPADMLSDSERERQLELEIQSFAELLLDIHEYRRQRKRNSALQADA